MSINQFDSNSNTEVETADMSDTPREASYETADTSDTPLEPTSDRISQNDLKDYYMRLFLKLNNYHLIPRSTCNEIMNDIEIIFNLSNQLLTQELQKAHQNNLIKDNFNTVLHNLRQLDLSEIHQECRGEKAKLAWLKKTELYVEPVKILLSPNHHYYYIPVIENIKALFKNNEFKEQYFKSNTQMSSDGKIRSFRDSECFKKNKLFSSDSNSIQIKLFTDAYGNSNPLSDSRSTNKLNGIYYTIGNLEGKFNSKDYYTQLLIKVDDSYIKQFGFEKILKPFVDDLIELETSGISTSYNYDLILFRLNFQFYHIFVLSRNNFVHSSRQFRRKRHYGLG
jgi:hypothetical protein